MAWSGSTLEHENAALIAQMQREDIQTLAERTKGKQKEGSLSDGDLALELYLEDLNLFDLSHHDHQIACSIATAVVDDCFLLGDALNVDLQVTADRELALRLEHTSDDSPINAEHGIIISKEEQLDSETQAKLQARMFAEMFGMRNPPWKTADQPVAESSKWAASRKPAHLHDSIRCVACHDNAPWFDTVTAPCGDVYCADCLSTLFESSMTDESLYPPRCCREPILFAQVKAFLSPTVAKAFAGKQVELDTKNRTYCWVPSCVSFIPPSAIGGDAGTCPSCTRSTCFICKAAAHPGDCPEDEQLQELLDTANQEGWQRCYQCARMVELELGCNHMTCICRAEFCYACGERWKTCPCEQWEENQLMQRAQRIAGRRDNENRRLYQPPRHVIDEEIAIPDLVDNDDVPAPVPAPVPAARRAPPGPGVTGPAVRPRPMFGGLAPLHQQAGPAARPATEPGRQDEHLIVDSSSDSDVDIQPPAPRRPLKHVEPRPATVQRSGRQIEDIMQNLRENHECEHRSWLYIRGSHQCEECHHQLPRYIFECRQCELQACWRCRKNRL